MTPRAMGLAAAACVVAAAAPGQMEGPEFDKDAFIASASTGAVLEVRVADCLAWTLKRNRSVGVARMTPLIRAREVEAARAAVSGAALNAETTARDADALLPLPGGLTTNTSAGSVGAQVGVSGRLPAGARYEAGLSARRVDESPARQAASPRWEVGPLITVTQPLWRGAGRRVNEAEVDIAVNRHRASRLAVVEAIMDAVTDSVVAYHGCGYAAQAYALAAEALKRAEDLLAINRERFAKGLISSVDLLEAEAAVAQRRKALIAGESAVRRTEDVLRQSMGLLDEPALWNARLVLIDEPSEESRPADLTQSLVSAFANRPDYAVRLLDLRNRDIQIVLAADARHPVLDLVGSFGLNGIAEDYGTAMDNVDGESREWLAGLRLTVPLSGGERARHDQRRLEKAQALMDLKRIEQRIILEVRDAVREADVQFRQLEASRLALDRERENYRAQEDRYRAGQVSTHDMLDYQNRLSSAEVDYRRARVEYQNALAGRDRAEGSTLARNGITLEE